MELRPGYKQTEVGVIPEDWNQAKIGNLFSICVGRDLREELFLPYCDTVHKYPVYSNTVDNFGLYGFYSVPEYNGDSLTVVGRGVGLGTAFARTGSYGAIGRLIVLFPNHQVDSRFLAAYINQKLTIFHESSGIPQLTGIQISRYKVVVPPLEEQRAIATALSDFDSLLIALGRLIAKKRDLKHAAMQQLLTGQTRLPGFEGEWKVRLLGDVTDCLDNLRVPLNESQRNQMKGDYPYCGANGVLDFVNDYAIDDDIILMAEDGGYFDEYAYRPIAYRMVGKCWVNNHAHILKTKVEHDQGFMFYSLVHKNILSYLASGTRTKLNKSEMNKIEVKLPLEKEEQTAIAAILSNMDAEIAALEARHEKTRLLKQGMMQELLTGRIRLV